jgi:gamma-glutamyltranspeptidase/glutathione hydrolase
MRSVGLFFLMLAAVTGDPPTIFPAVRGMREMIAAGNHHQVEAGWRLLQAGGNAVDAGVAAVLAAAVTEQSRIGLGGEMPLIVAPAGRPPTVISGVGRAPRLATVAAYRNRTPGPFENPRELAPIPAVGIQSAITPGLLDGLILALRRYGTRSFAEVVAPAIEFADGFPVGEEVVSFLTREEKTLRYWPDSTRFFLPVPAPGQVVRHRELAATLRTLADVERKQAGSRDRKLQAVRDSFYRGPLAREIAQFNQENGGWIRYEDMSSYQAEEERTRSVIFHGYTVHKPGFWTQGPVMLQMLNLLKGYDLKAMGHNSPEYLHTLIEVVKLAFADRDTHYGDPQFSQIPEDWLLSEEYAAERRRMIEPDRASMEHRPGRGPVTKQAIPARGAEAHDTTCVNVVDRWGNVFNATPSGAWLPSVIAGRTGVPLSSRLESFVLDDGHPNQLAPGKRPRVTLSPTLVTRDGKPYLAMSTPGGDNQDQAMLQVLLNLVVFGMKPQDAVEAPRFQTEHFKASFGNHEFRPGEVALESRFPAATVEALRKKGHQVQVKGPWSNGSAPTVIRMQEGVLEGGADPRRNRFILAR